MQDTAKHQCALRAVARDGYCPDRLLLAAEKAGLIRFKSWPAGHWQLTPAGRAALAEAA